MTDSRTNSVSITNSERLNHLTHHVDVVVVGAGFAGIYTVHKFRDQMGLTVQAFDQASDVGGTWYWNRYPGARCDIESIHYSYSFSDDLQQEWEWSEKFAAQPEILAYLNHVADRFDIRRSVRFNTRITSIRWHAEEGRWYVKTDDGGVTIAQFVISCAGNLSVPKTPDFPGIDDFTGRVLLTGNWPHDPVDFSGRRVGIIGTGSTAIQAISVISKNVGELSVFQRTPNYATPISNAPADPEEVRSVKAEYAAIRTASRNHFLGVPYTEVQPSALAVSAEERRATFDDRWNRGGFRLFIDSYQDILVNQEANETVAEYIRGRIHQRVQDPGVAELLAPQGYAYGTKRPPLETDYYEAFNRPNVHLVDVKSDPIERVTATGLRTASGREFDFDVLILATGFDAMTGPLLAMNITGANGLPLKEKWADGPQTYLGITVSGFPNFFMITGPQSPSVLYNMPLAIEDHIDFAAEAIDHVLKSGLTTIEAEPHAERDWVQHSNELASATLLPDTDSWYMGANIPGKPRKCLVYLGGAPAYRATCDEVVAKGYEGYRLVGDAVSAEA